ncbi:MAG: IS110 family transposase [Caldilineaceae bacterium SB0662_bin_9]|uniref:IS110 family transposase n=1 Tax=Caldilineaceae bacterium SB0662_bin_9 TaxID=2605258 RepID=A0A6B1DUW3_9CHLR|nr:IS110 family transposase [Caldilineaceae bacterium SB0662_bin_9]
MVVVTGIDVSKAMLDVALAEGPVYRFANSGPGLRRLLHHRDLAGTTQAVCEATGGYEQLLVSQPGAAGITVQMAPPPRVHAFARLRLRDEDRPLGGPGARALWPSVPGLGLRSARERGGM